jgi:DNA mismatch repair protein MSH5
MIRPATEFTYFSAKSKLCSLQIGESRGPTLTLQIPTDPHQVSGNEHSRSDFIKLSAWINTDSKVSVGCAGAVLSYLQKKKTVETMGAGQDATLHICNIEMFSLADVM